MIPLMSEHDRWLKAIYTDQARASPRLSHDEIDHLSYCAGMAACCCSISKNEYLRAENAANSALARD